MPHPPTRSGRWLVAAGLIVLAGLLLALAGTLRWAPCFVGDRALCLVRQEQRFSYIVPVQPWQALPGVTWLAGLGMVLVGAVWPVVAPRLRVPPRRRILITVLLTAKPVLFGVLTLISAATGTTWGVVGHALVGVDGILDVAAIGFLVLLPEYPPGDYRRAILAVVAFLAVGQIPLIMEYVVLGLFGSSAGVTPPGTGLVIAAVVLACGVAIGVATVRTPDPRSPALAPRNPLERPADR